MLLHHGRGEALDVLVVEHRDSMAWRLQVQLERLGHRVVARARDGREALSAAEKLQPSLVLMETALPGLDSVDTARAIALQRQVPVILLAGYAGAELVRRAQEAGVVACVTSVDEHHLLAAIAIAEQRRAELRILRREAADPSETLATQRLVERAKKALITGLGLSGPEAFRHILERKLSTRRSLGETAWTIIEAQGVLARPDFARHLQVICQTVRESLSRRRAAKDDTPHVPGRR